MSLEAVSLSEATESTNFQVTYQPERVSVRLSLEPDANAFRLIRPNERYSYSAASFESETASLYREVNQVRQPMKLAFQSDEPTGDEKFGSYDLAINLLLQLDKPTGGR